MSELKKCPCCGGSASVTIYEPQENEVYTYFTRRYAILCQHTGSEEGCGLESGHFKSLEEAVATWNTRSNAAGVCAICKTSDYCTMSICQRCDREQKAKAERAAAIEALERVRSHYEGDAGYSVTPIGGVRAYIDAELAKLRGEK